MKIKEKIEWKIPAYYASAIINNDYSGLSEQEEKELNDFIKKNIEGDLTLEDMNQEPYFSWSNDVNALGSDVLDFVELIYV